MRWWRIAALVLLVALVASVAVGLLGWWPDLHGSSVSGRREKTRIAVAVNDFMGGSDWHVTDVRLAYLPHRALLELQKYSNGRRSCALVPEDFGNVVDANDVQITACDF